MKQYCLIQNIINEEDNTSSFQIVEGPCELPENHGNVSNLHLLQDGELKSIGWLPCEEVSDNKAILTSISYEILEDKVLIKKTTRDKTPQELEVEKLKQKEAALQKLRQNRDVFLSKSDIFIMPDKWQLMDEETKNMWTVYRQTLRDLPTSSEDPSNIVFPAFPV